MFTSLVVFLGLVLSRSLDGTKGQGRVVVWGVGGGGQSSQLTVALNPGQTEEGPWGCGRVGAVYPQVPEEGATDGGERDYLPWSELLPAEAKDPLLGNSMWARVGRCRHPRASSF